MFGTIIEGDCGNSFEGILNFIVYRDGDEPTLVRLPAGGWRTQHSRIHFLTYIGSVNLHFK